MPDVTTTKLTAKLEEAIADARKGCLYPARCEHCDAVKALAAEVLAGRKRDIAMWKALERISKGSRNAALPSVVALLAAMEVPDDE